MGKKRKPAQDGPGSATPSEPPSSAALWAGAAAAAAIAFACGLWLGVFGGGPPVDTMATLRELRRLLAAGDVAAADAFLGGVGHDSFQGQLTRAVFSRRTGAAEKAEAALGMVALTALSDSTGAVDVHLYTTLDRLDAEDSYSARLGYEYGSGLRQREEKRREPLSKQLAYDDAMKRLRPVPIGGWIGDATDGAAIGEPVHTARGDVVTVYSRRPLIVAIDNFLSESAVSKNGLFAMPFTYKNDYFTKTGSGQTQGKLQKRSVFPQAAAAVQAHDAAFDARIKVGETVCINDKTSAAKLRSMTDQLAELAKADNAPSSWRPQQRPGLVCVPSTPSISEKFLRASTSINFEVGASSVIDNIENTVASSIGARDAHVFCNAI
jgi:hypothetical protein